MEDSYNLNSIRRNIVAKDNLLIQQSRHQFSLQQQKILLFIVSQLDSQNQNTFNEQTFDISDFCRACDIELNSGKNYSDLKAAVLGIRNKGFWVNIGGDEVTMSWICRAKISPKSGKITIELDDMMKPFLLELSANFTKYSLIYTLTMRSKYAVRLYELMKSYENMSQPIEFTIDRLKKLIGAEYTKWGDLDRRAIKVAVMEMNTVSDIIVKYNGIKAGRSFVAVKFWIERKKGFENEIATNRAIHNRLNGKRDRHQPQQVDGQM